MREVGEQHAVAQVEERAPVACLRACERRRAAARATRAGQRYDGVDRDVAGRLPALHLLEFLVDLEEALEMRGLARVVAPQVHGLALAADLVQRLDRLGARRHPRHEDMRRAGRGRA